MNNPIKKLFIPLFICLFVYLYICIFPTKTSAANISLGIYPPIITIQAVAPSDIKSPITITNESNDPVDVHIGVRPFTQNSNDNGQPQYLTAGSPLGNDPHIYEKMSIFDGTKNTSDLTLAPNQKKNVELRISLPTGEPPGDYYFSIVFISKAISTDHIGSAVSGGISTNVLLSIGPHGPTSGYITDFSSPLFVESGPIPFTVLVQNTSKHFIVPQGTILIKNMFGQTIGKVDLEQDNILAGTSRYLPDNTAGLSHTSVHPFALWNEKFLLGPYSATITLALSGEGPLYRRTIYFFALPTQILIGIILGIILVAVVVYRVRKRLNS